MKIGYLKIGEDYLIVKEDGKSVIVKGEEKFNKYLTENNCEIID